MAWDANEFLPPLLIGKVDCLSVFLYLESRKFSVRTGVLAKAICVSRAFQYKGVDGVYGVRSTKDCYCIADELRLGTGGGAAREDH